MHVHCELDVPLCHSFEGMLHLCCPTEAWMCCRLASRASSLSIGTTEESVLTLPLLAYPCAVVYQPPCVCAPRGPYWVQRAGSESLALLFLVVYCHISFRVGGRDHVCLGGLGKGGTTKKYFPSGSRHTLPIPDPDASVFPIHNGAKVSSLRR